MTTKNRLHATRCVAPSVALLAVTSALAGCGTYDQALPATGGSPGQMMTTAMANAAGRAGSGAPAGMAPQGASGSTSGTGGSGATVTPVEASCEAVTPCGGDLVGTWAVAGSCLPVSGDADMSGFGLGCSAAPVTGSLEVSGTWTANGDGTFSDQTTTAGDSEIQLPASCLNVSGTVTTCNRVGGPLQALGFASVTCEASEDGGCTCAATARQTGGLAILSLDASASGMYLAADNVVTTTARAALDYAYCVSGNTLTITPRGTSKTGAVTGTIVLQKQ